MRKITALLLMAILLIPMVATAQDGWQTHVHESGELSVSYPDAWFAVDDAPDEGEETISISISNNESLFGNDSLNPHLESGEIVLNIGKMKSSDIKEFGVVGLENQSIELFSGYWIGFLAMARQFQTMFSEDEEPIHMAIVDYWEDSINDLETGFILLEYGDNNLLYIFAYLDENTILFSSTAIYLNEFDQHEETIMQIIESITLSETE